MINKRLLIKNLLAHNNENSFYDKKRQLDFETKQGKSKFLKHVCALSNANPNNNSYIIIGVEDEDNALTGVDFFDDSKIQNIVNAYLENPPKVLYENIPFPRLTKPKVLGLVTISPNKNIAAFKKTINIITKGTIYCRIGSVSMPVVYPYDVKTENKELVQAVENNSKNQIKDTLDSVVAFVNRDHPDMNPEYIVFKEIFVLCWAGKKKSVKDRVYYSRVDIELINEQVKLFYSALDEVSIAYTENSFEITEYVSAKINQRRDFYPLEKVVFRFFDNGDYTISRAMLFKVPQYEKGLLDSLYNKCLSQVELILNDSVLQNQDLSSLNNIASRLMICHLMGYPQALNCLMKLYNKIKMSDVYKLTHSIKGALRILRKIKYEYDK